MKKTYSYISLPKYDFARTNLQFCLIDKVYPLINPVKVSLNKCPASSAPPCCDRSRMGFLEKVGSWKDLLEDPICIPIDMRLQIACLILFRIIIICVNVSFSWEEGYLILKIIYCCRDGLFLLVNFFS